MFGKHEVPHKSLNSMRFTLNAYIFLIFLIYKFRGYQASMLSHPRRCLVPIHAIGCSLNAFSPLITGTNNEYKFNKETK